MATRESAITQVEIALKEAGIELEKNKVEAVADALNEKGELSVEELDQIAGGLKINLPGGKELFDTDNITQEQIKAVKIGGAAMAALVAVGLGKVAWDKNAGGVKDKINVGLGRGKMVDDKKRGGFLWLTTKKVGEHYEPNK